MATVKIEYLIEMSCVYSQEKNKHTYILVIISSVYILNWLFNVYKCAIYYLQRDSLKLAKLDYENELEGIYRSDHDTNAQRVIIRKLVIV